MNSPSDSRLPTSTPPVAVIGIGCLFPRSGNLQSFWRLIFRGEDGISDVPPTHWSVADYYDPDPKRPDHVYCARGGFLSPYPFDPTEFGIPPASLATTDTSQLLALVAAKAALEDAGYGHERSFDRDRVSVILGVTGTQELVIPLSARLGHPRWRRALQQAGVSPQQSEQVVRQISETYVAWEQNSFPGLLGNVVAGRICNRLNLGGTNCVVDAACASSLSAVHMAVMELATGRSDMVITGGADTLNDIFMHMCFAKTQILSQSGEVRPFSEAADGTLLGEGIGLLILKREEQAREDGDRIYAVIKGIGSASDGRSQSVYAPGVDGQVKALRAAYASADIDPATVELLEAHGTGTRVGDRVEIEALKKVFPTTGERSAPCALGSVKANIGHTKAAAGAAGLIKALLALHHKVLPPTIKVDRPDPAMELDQSQFYLNATARPWFSAEGRPRRAAVSSFGFGGSNFHLVLEEAAAAKEETAWDGATQIFAFGAATGSELAEKIDAARLTLGKATAPEALAAQAWTSRRAFTPDAPHRLVIVCEQHHGVVTRADRLLAQAKKAIHSDAAQDGGDTAVFYGKHKPPGRLAFLFPGQGSQYPGMGRDIVCTFPEAFGALQSADRCFNGEQRLSDLIFPLTAYADNARTAQSQALQQTEAAQPAIGAISMAMVRVLARLGIKPEATCGHSFGELTALCAAGWLEPEVFFDLAATRGRLMAAAGRDANQAGAMLAVKAPLDAIAELVAALSAPLVLANRNSPNQGVLSGSRKAIREAEQLCRRRGYRSIRLPVSAAFHSELVREAQKPFARALKRIDLTPTEVAVYSNATGEPYPRDPDAARAILSRHLLQPVDFVKEVEALHRAGVRTFVEVGPRTVLTGLVQAILMKRPFQALALDQSAGRRSSMADLACMVGRIAAAGYPVALDRWQPPCGKQRQARMAVTISGANYVPPSKQTMQDAAIPGASDTVSPAAVDAQSRVPAAARRVKSRAINHDARTRGEARPSASRWTSPPNPQPPQPKQSGKMDTDNRNRSRQLIEALQAVRQGLQSMQALQAQTAEAHKKFLETQKEANRSLQAMVQQTRLLAGLPAGDCQAQPFAEMELCEPSGAPQAAPDPSFAEQPHPAPAAAQEVEPAGSVEANPGVKPTGTSKALSRTLVEIVSELTGYPPEMIGLDMDIEADLGVDSIKRVEILSALEEKMPGLPPVGPENAATLKTLGQIAAFLADGSKSPGAAETHPQGGAVPDAATPAAARPQAAAAETQSISAVLVDVVSELTGYPPEMIGLDMDIEADLGVDSIKRVEILSALEEKMPGLPPVGPENAATLKTLGQIAAFLADGSKSPGAAETHPQGEAVAQSDPAPTGCDADASPGALCESVARRVVSLVDRPHVHDSRLQIPPGRKVLITEDGSGLSEAIAEAFGRQGINSLRISCDILKYKKQLPRAAGLVLVADPGRDYDAAALAELLGLVQRLAPDLHEAARSGGAFLVTATRLDGAFGFRGQGVVHPSQAALGALAKTAAREWPAVTCRALDVAPGWQNLSAIAEACVAEALTPEPGGPLEIGLAAEQRVLLELIEAPLPDPGKPGPDLKAEDVLVITGGARGITAEAAAALARHGRPTLVLLGRTPEPENEPAWLDGIEEPAAMKRAILHNEFHGRVDSPHVVETVFQRCTAKREIRRNLERIRALGARAAYYSVDVREEHAVADALESARRQYGPITGIIHGAGVLSDALITAKTAEQLAQVYDTKVKGLQALLAATSGDPLRYLVLFSSITARLGNRGQADYAMANEVLNKTAQHLAVQKPDCRVIAINWGPFDGGMVSGAVKREFSRRGIELIVPSVGARQLLAEMNTPPQAGTEVVIDRGWDTHAGSGETDGLTYTFKREIDLQHYPVLKSHVLDGKPVVPLALMAEWLAHGALHENPGLQLCGIDDIRLLKGVKLEQDKQVVRLMAGKARRRGAIYTVDVEIRDGYKQGREIVHTRATAVLGEKLEPPPAYQRPVSSPAAQYRRSIQEIYDKILFHGKDLRGLEAVHACSPEGMVAQVSAAPSPGAWMREPLRNTWLLDPLVLDSAFQMASLWCFEQKGMVSLPAYAAAYRQYRLRFPSEGATAVLEVSEAGERKIKGDFTFLDGDGQVVARLSGFEAIMDPALHASFKPQRTAHN